MRTRLDIGIAVAVLAAGCGGGRDATDKQLSALRAELVTVRADNAVLAERLDAIELARDGFRGRPPRAEDAGRERGSPSSVDARHEPAQERPDLQVVRLSPEAQDEGGARPVLRSTTGGVVVEGDGEGPSSPRANGPPRVSPPSKQPPTPSRRTP